MTDLTPAPDATPAPPADLAPLFERFPACFDWADPKPLKIGINGDLLASGALGEGCDAKALRRMLTRYCARRRYWRALKEGATRVDLHGRPAGAVSADDAENARERLAAWKARMKAKGSGPPASPDAGPPPVAPVTDRPAGAALSDDTPIPKEHLVPGRLELTVKFSEMPTPVPVEGGVKIGVETGEGVVTAVLPPKVWRKLEQAAKDYPAWVASVSGSLARIANGEIALKNPAVQVFEKKLKPPGDAAPAENPPPEPAAQTPATAGIPNPANPANPAIARATLSLKSKNAKTG